MEKSLIELKLQHFFAYKQIKFDLVSFFSRIPSLIIKENPIENREFYNELSIFLKESKIRLIFTTYSFTTLLLNSLKESNFSLNYKENTIKMCENISSENQMKILTFLLKNDDIKQKIFCAISQEKTEEINVNLLDLLEFLFVIFLIKTEISDEILIKKLAIIVKCFVDNWKLSRKSLIKLNFLAIFLEFLSRILFKIEFFTDDLSENLLNLMVLINKERILRFFLYKKKNISSLYSMNALIKFNDKIMGQIFANTVNILLIFYVKSEFLPKKHRFLLMKQFEDFLRFYQYIYRKNRLSKKNPNSIEKLLRLLLFIQDDYFLIFSLKFISNLAYLTEFPAFKACKKWGFVEFIVKALDYNEFFTVEFLMKDALFLELLMKMVNLLCKENDKTDKNTKLYLFFSNLLIKLKLEKSNFIYKISPLLKKLEFLLNYYFFF